MKKFLITICTFIGIVGFAIAETLNVTWYNTDGTTYDTTTCTVGGTLTLPTTPTRYGYTFRGWAIYNPIEYIESTGTQYIDTGIYGNLNTSYELVMQAGEIFSKISVAFGARESAVAKNIGVVIEDATNSFLVDFGDYSITRLTVSNSSIPRTNKVKIYNSKDYRYVEDLSTGIKREATTKYTSSFATPLTMRIGQKSTGFTAGMTNFSGKIYLVRIWDDATLVRDMIPVLDANGVPCMYDKVSHQFFYDSGTGDFIAGPAI